MRILVAPDKFKHALTAAEAAAAIAAGVRDAAPTAEIVPRPLADGGEGSGDLLAEACGARPVTCDVLDALGRPIRATCWFDAPNQRIIIELARVAGIAQLAPQERDPTRTTTFGIGQMLSAAVTAGAKSVDLCVGGSATCDGGAGCLQALGWSFEFSATDRPLSCPLSGGELSSLRRLLAPPRAQFPRVRVLCDVQNPLLGANGAAEVFAPQKGATPEQTVALARGLENWSHLLHAAHGRDPAHVDRGGAAGGIAAGLWAALGAELHEGFATVAEAVDLRAKLGGATLCITGEGRIDEQSLAGKVVGGVARLGRAAGVPVVALAGTIRVPAGESRAGFLERLGLREAIALHEGAPGAAACDAAPPADVLARTAADLRRTAAHIARRHLRDHRAAPVDRAGNSEGFENAP